MAPYPTHSAEERILGPLCYRTAHVREKPGKSALHVEECRRACRFHAATALYHQERHCSYRFCPEGCSFGGDGIAAYTKQQLGLKRFTVAIKAKNCKVVVALSHSLVFCALR